jgi:hypothetical protein
MPGLIRGVARTAAIAGTATAVSGRVQRRQAEKFATRDANIYAEREAAYEQTQPAPQQAPQQVVYAAPPPAPAPAPAPAAAGGSDIADQIKQLADLKAQGILTDEEFAAGKAKILGG